MATVNKPHSTPPAGSRKPATAKAPPASPLFVELMEAMQSVRRHATGKAKLKSTTMSVPVKPRRVAAKRAAGKSRPRKPG